MDIFVVVDTYRLADCNRVSLMSLAAATQHLGYIAIGIQLVSKG